VAAFLNTSKKTVKLQFMIAAFFIRVMIVSGKAFD
jgi:hypothetical protein